MEGFCVAWGVGIGVALLCVWVLPALHSAVKNRRNSGEPYPDVYGANIVSGNGLSIPTFPPIRLPTFHVSRSGMSALNPSQSPTTSPGLPLRQTSPTGGAMSEGPGAEPAHLVQLPGSDAVGFLQYEDSVSIPVPPTAYIAV